MNDFQTLHSSLFDVDRIPFALAAIVLCAIIGMVTGPFGGNAFPFYWQVQDRCFGWLARRLDKTQRKRNDLVTRGLFMTVFIVCFAAALGGVLDEIALWLSFYGLMEVLILCLVLSAGAVWFTILQIYFALEKKPKPGDLKKYSSYFTLARTSRVDLSAMDDYGITRVAIGTLTRSFEKTLVGPVFWYIIGGLPLAFLSAGLAAFSWSVGKDGFSKGFGVVPLMLEKLMGIGPSLFSAILLAGATFLTPTTSIVKGFSVLSRLGGQSTRYEQGGLPLTLMAQVLNVTLGGPVTDRSGHGYKGQWVGPDGATAQVDYKHLRRALYLHAMATVLFVASLVLVMLWV